MHTFPLDIYLHIIYLAAQSSCLWHIGLTRHGAWTRCPTGRHTDSLGANRVVAIARKPDHLDDDVETA